MIDERRNNLISALRDCADFLVMHPNVPIPTYSTMTAFVRDKATLTLAASKGGWEKDWDSDTYFNLRKTFCEDLKLEVTANREVVCQKIVTGTRVVPAQPEREVEIVEWQCDEPSLLAGE